MLALVCAAFGWIGLWQALSDWRVQRDRQLLLDRCVGRSAQALANALTRLDQADRVIRATRASLSVSVLPQAQAALRAALALQVGYFQALLVRWRARQLQWIMEGGCAELSQTLALPYPSPPWKAQTPDALGPRPWKWEGQREWTLQAMRLPRKAKAYVFSSESGWKASFRKP